MRHHYYMNRWVKTAFFGLAAVVGAGGVLVMSNVAFGAANRTLYVGHGSTGSDKSCSSPGYINVQSAVDAASAGNTVYLCGGQFAEQVFINKSITLTGDSSSGLTAVGTTFTGLTSRFPSQFASDGLFVPQSLITLTGAGTKATISGLTVSGPMPGDGGCAEDEFGILALAGNVTLQNDKVLNIADSSSGLYGCQFGVAIQIGREYWPKSDFSSDLTENFKATATIDHVSVSGYEKNGITVDGAGSRATITNSSVTGGGRGIFGADTAQNGIQISRGAGGSVLSSYVSNNDYTNTGWASSAGILIFGGYGDPLVANVMIANNRIVNNDIGIALDNYNADASAPASSPTRDQAINNQISDNAVTNISGLCYGAIACGGKLIGYQAGISDVGDRDIIVGNTISGKGYNAEGLYNYKVNPPVFTKTGPDNAVVLPIDTGSTFPTTDPVVAGNHL